MRDQLHPFFLAAAKKYLADISDADRGAIFRDVAALMGRDFDLVRTKQLKGPIRELIRGHHRITYFQSGPTVYFVRGFRKKSKKTPRQEIEYAETMYRRL